MPFFYHTSHKGFIFKVHNHTGGHKKGERHVINYFKVTAPAESVPCLGLPKYLVVISKEIK